MPDPEKTRKFSMFLAAVFAASVVMYELKK